MSILSLSPAANGGDDSTPVRSGILGATGLSRAVLAEIFCRDGLFGPDSALNAAEQAVVEAHLGAASGLPVGSDPKPADPRLRALAGYTAALVARQGVSRAQDLAAIRQAGFSAGAVAEVGNIVRVVRDVFGLRPRPCGQVRLGTVALVEATRARAA